MLYAIVALLVLIADQALKYYVTLNIPLDGEAVTFLPGIMSLTHYHNTGAAFGMLSGGGARWAFILVAVVFTAATIYLILNRKLPTKFLNWSLVLITAGAVGNAIDRFFYGYVVDMFQTEFMDFAIFNVADIAITCGGAALCLAILLMPSDKDQTIIVQTEDGEEISVQKEKGGIKLVSEKAPLPEEIEESRRTGKLFKDKPLDAEDPFAEFEAMPTKFEEEKKEEEILPDITLAEALAEDITRQTKRDLAVEEILKEFADGTN